MKRTNVVLTVAVLAAILLSASAQATWMTYNGTALKRAVTIHHPDLASGKRVYAGQLKIDYNGKSYVTYCVDVLQTIKSYEGADDAITSLNNGQVVSWLYENYAPSVATDDEAAALQVAIWEVVNELNNPFDVQSGDFYLTDTRTEVITKANQILTDIELPTDFDPSQWLVTNADYQDVIIPEPATMLTLGLGSFIFLAGKKTAK